MTDAVQTRQITADEYFASYPETMLPMELWHGEVIMSPAPSHDHQQLVGNLHIPIGLFVRQNELGLVCLSPTDLVLSKKLVLQPDLFFVAKDNTRCTLKDGRWYGAPDLCIEVVSPGSGRRDRVDKFSAYAQHGVREYWIVDAAEHFIEVYILEGNDFKRQGAYTESDTFSSTVLAGFTVSVKEIFPQQDQ